MYDVIVVGAGYGGVTCAGLLTKYGYKVALVDKNPKAGGKAMSVSKKGFVYEMWPILGGPSVPSRFHELVDILQLHDDVDLLTSSETSEEFRYIKSDGRVVTSPFPTQGSYGDSNEMNRVLSEAGISLAEAGNLLKLMAAILSTTPEQLEGLEHVSVFEWVRSFEIGSVLESYQFSLCNLLFVVALDKLPAAEAIRTLRDFYQGGAGRYHRKGYGYVAQAVVGYIQNHGGTWLPKTKVDQILVEDDSAVGIKAGGKVYKGKTVVSNAGLQPTVLKLLEPYSSTALPPDYLEWVKRLEPSWAFVGVRYFVDAPVFDKASIIQFSDESWWDTERFESARNGSWPDQPLLFIVVPCLYDPLLSPDPSHQVILAGTMCSPDPSSPMNQAAVGKVEKVMEKYWPDLRWHTTKKEAFTSQNISAQSRASVVFGQGGECIGLGQVIGQCGPDKPNPKSPLSRLWFVGCDAGGYGCGTHQAVESGFQVAEMVAKELG